MKALAFGISHSHVEMWKEQKIKVKVLRLH